MTPPASHVRCIRLSAVLCALACGRRYVEAQQRYWPPHLVMCRDCPLGALHARGVKAGPARDHRSLGREGVKECHERAKWIAIRGRDVLPFRREDL